MAHIPTDPIDFSRPNPFGDLVTGRLAERQQEPPTPERGALSPPTPPELVFPELAKPAGPSPQDRRQARFQTVAEGLLAFSQLFAGKDFELPGKAMAALRAQEGASDEERRRLENAERTSRARLENERRISEFEIERRVFLDKAKEQRVLQNSVKKQREFLELALEFDPRDPVFSAASDFAANELPRIFTAGEVESDDVLRDRALSLLPGLKDDPRKLEKVVRMFQITEEGIAFGIRETRRTAVDKAKPPIASAASNFRGAFNQAVEGVTSRQVADLNREIKAKEDDVSGPIKDKEDAIKATSEFVNSAKNDIRTELALRADEDPNNQDLKDLLEDFDKRRVKFTDLAQIAQATESPPLTGIKIVTRLQRFFRDPDFLDATPFKDDKGNDSEETIREAVIRLSSDLEESGRLADEIDALKGERDVFVQEKRDEINARFEFPLDFTSDAEIKGLRLQANFLSRADEVLGAQAHELLTRKHSKARAEEDPFSLRSDLIEAPRPIATPTDIRSGRANPPVSPTDSAFQDLVKSAPNDDASESLGRSIGALQQDLLAADNEGTIGALGADIYQDFLIEVFNRGGSTVKLREWAVEFINASGNDGEAVVSGWEAELGIGK